ncbi:hypothetical protein FVB32_11505 [Flagellimonas hymeniacidonis]|uniref:Fatty acid hydroxylase domain-containing protein n=1 Tax=Flagellimonas hymeniacidonis TaxID=2603628 RepID=A0A5C8V363_9FLAO|nr:sterol desaturase family protein [Flagellimonas hymeniacidonis]TXN35208.1 hypothetical protein FVB32_11505 [Flagellimonas hymeniacidonis]
MITPLEILSDPVSITVLAMYALLMFWEAVYPAQVLPKVKFWKLRGLSAFAFFFFLSSYLPLFIDPYLEPYRLLDLTNLTTVIGGLVGVFLYEFGVYVWHRSLHKSNFLWRTFHQMHHSAERLDTFGAFYFSPLDMIGWTVLGSVCFTLLIGLSPQAITVMLLVTNFLGMFQHANIKTAPWLGYIIQRPESHTVHHAKGIHKHNYSDLPIFDILFGTFKNPKTYEHETGFFHGASAKVLQMLMFKDLNKINGKKSKTAKTIAKATVVLIITFMVFSCSNDDSESIIETPEPIQIVTVSTLAGNGEDGLVNGTVNEAQFDYPQDIAIDNEGTIYVADSRNHVIRKITQDGMVSTYAGSMQGDGDGTLLNAKFNIPRGVAVDNSGNVYVADTNNNKIKKITPMGVVVTLAGKSEDGYEDGPGSEAQFNYPSDIDIDSEGNLFVADYYNHKIRKITPEGIVSTVAGGDIGFADGPAMSAQFDHPTSVTVDALGNLFVADNENHKIRKISTDGMVSTLAGSIDGYADGNGANAKFNYPEYVAVDGNGYLYVTDTYNYRVRKISPNGDVTTLAGSTEGFSDGIGNIAQFNQPRGIAIGADNIIYAADERNHSIRKITIEESN